MEEFWLLAVPFVNTERSIAPICEVMFSSSTVFDSTVFLNITCPFLSRISLMKHGSFHSPSLHLYTLPERMVWYAVLISPSVISFTPSGMLNTFCSFWWIPISCANLAYSAIESERRKSGQ